jgi:hypothetical protein
MKNVTLYLQLVEYSTDDERAFCTNALYTFCELMKCPVHLVDDGHLDSFVVEMPESDYLFCLAVNAFDAFCYLYKIASELSVPPDLD